MNIYRSKSEQQGYRAKSFALLIKAYLRFGFLTRFKEPYERWTLRLLRESRSISLFRLLPFLSLINSLLKPRNLLHQLHALIAHPSQQFFTFLRHTIHLRNFLHARIRPIELVRKPLRMIISDHSSSSIRPNDLHQ